MKKLFIVGSTGHLGRQALDVVERLGKDFKVVGITGFHNLNLLYEQFTLFKPQYVGVSKDIFSDIRNKLQGAVVFELGDLDSLIMDASPDLTLFLSSGITSLSAIYKLISNGFMCAIANKEAIIAGGEILFNQDTRRFVIPVDSEPSGIFQCLMGRDSSFIRELFITASGGPFRDRKQSELEDVKVEDALKHPSWNMGRKVTIDSATLVNKAFEVIESHFLFDVPYSHINVLLHRESIVHALVECQDGTLNAVMSMPDMRLPIQFAITYPERVNTSLPRLNLSQIGVLHFEDIDPERFPSFSTALAFGRQGGSFLPYLVGIDEVLVNAFLKEEIKFTDINSILMYTLSSFDKTEVKSIEDVEELYNSAIIKATQILRRRL